MASRVMSGREVGGAAECEVSGRCVTQDHLLFPPAERVRVPLGGLLRNASRRRHQHVPEVPLSKGSAQQPIVKGAACRPGR